MRQSTHYGLKLAEGTDLVNPLSIDVPNYEDIDDIMFDNETAGVGSATELKTGTVHALTRVKSSQNVFRFRATSVFNTGDTFTVDGSSVSAQYADGTTLSDRAYIIGSDVLCALIGTQLTFFINKEYDASGVSFDSANVSYTANNVQSAIEQASTATGTSYDTTRNVKQKIGDLRIGELERFTPSANETFGSLLEKLRDESTLKSAYTVIRLSVDGVSNITFRNTRFASQSLNTWEATVGSSSSLTTYIIGISSSSVSLRKYAHSSSGLNITEMRDNTAESVLIVAGFVND